MTVRVGTLIGAIGLGVLCSAALWRGVQPPGSIEPDAQADAGLSRFQRAQVESLLANRLACLGCHVIGGRGGRLGPDLTTLGSRLDATAIARHLENPQGRVRQSIMPPVPMPLPWRALLVRYLEAAGEDPSLRAARRPDPVTTISETHGAQRDPSQGAALYLRLCAGCHGATGRGDGPNAPYLPVAPTPHANPSVIATRTDDWLFDIIARGGYVMNRHPFMPPYGGLLSPGEIRGLVAHLRELCACAAPRWSRDGQAGGVANR